MEKTRKKMLALILGLTASMTLGACGGGTSSGTSNSGTDPVSNSTSSSEGPASDTPISDSASDSPVSSGSEGPVSSGSEGPVSSGSEGPISSGSEGPISSGSEGPISSGSDSTSDPISESTSPSVESTSPSTSTSTSVAPLPDVVINGVARRASFDTYASNKGEKTNKKTEFYDRTQTYKVGTMNNFNVMPIVTFLDGTTGRETTVESWNYDIDIEVKVENAYQAIVNATSEYIDDVDTVNCDIDFSDLAQGHTFRITVTPDGLLPDQLEPEEISKWQTTMEVDVEDGFNVYDALDLAYLNNLAEDNIANSTLDSPESKDIEKARAWIAFKTEKNIDTTIQPTTFFFQDNIVITQDSLPSVYFYNVGDADLSASDPDYDRTVGSLRDWSEPYKYIFKEDTSDESIKIVGNYFNLDSSKLPIITRMDGNVTDEGTVVSHASLFLAWSRKQDMANKSFEFRDLNFLGNSPRTEDVAKSGGLILSKLRCGGKWENCLATSFFITFFNEKAVAPQLIDQCKAYDNFNSFVYNFGGTDLTINKSEMIGTGGPIIIQDHIWRTQARAQISNTKITESNLENYVAGNEGWFNVMPGAAALVPGVKALNAAFTPFGRTYLKTKEGTSGADAVTMFNFICVNKDGSTQGASNVEVKGRLTIDDNPYFDYGNYDGTSEASLGAFIAGVTSADPAAPIFQSCATGGYAYFNGTQLADLSGAILSPTHPVFTGDYLTLYSAGMMLTIGYMSAAQ